MDERRSPLHRTWEFYFDLPGTLALFRKRQPMVNLPHRINVAFAVLDDLGEFAGAVVGVDFGAVEVFFGGGDAEGF